MYWRPVYRCGSSVEGEAPAEPRARRLGRSLALHFSGNGPLSCHSSPEAARCDENAETGDGGGDDEQENPELMGRLPRSLGEEFRLGGLLQRRDAGGLRLGAERTDQRVAVGPFLPPPANG